jgi:RHS repeat-associated protein
VVDASGTHAYQYDGLGRQSQELWTASSALGGHAFTTSYTWNSFDQPSTITSPTGRVVSYTYDAVGRVSGVTSGLQTLVSGRAYRADGTLASQTFGNGIVETRTYDVAGRLAAWQIGSIETRVYGRDLNGNITSITTGGVAKNFGYDAIDRLLSEPSQSFAWDANGNRRSDASGSYVYQASTNRMTSGPAGSVGIDAAGNTTSIGSRAFAYSDSGRLVQAMNFGAVVGSYVYRADGLRAAKTTSSGTTLFHWDVAGNLIEESSATGASGSEYAWIHSVPLAQWQAGSGPVTLLHTDHAGTPRIGTTPIGNVVWRWDSGAFGQQLPSGTVLLNLRFAGQFYDGETGFYQNRYRTYDETSGRYLESDPIGLAAGLNTYSYVGGNPLSYTDPSGLWRFPDFVSFQINYYVGNVSGTFSRSGNSFFGMGLNKGIPNPVGAGASVNFGWLNTCDAKAIGSNVDSFLDGFSGGGAAAYAGIGGGILVSPGNGSATIVGVGAGVNVGGAPKFGGSPGFDVSRNLGPTGLGGW